MDGWTTMYTSNTLMSLDGTSALSLITLSALAGTAHSILKKSGPRGRFAGCSQVRMSSLCYQVEETQQIFFFKLHVMKVISPLFNVIL